MCGMNTLRRTPTSRPSSIPITWPTSQPSSAAGSAGSVPAHNVGARRSMHARKSQRSFGSSVRRSGRSALIGDFLPVSGVSAGRGRVERAK